MGSLIDMTNPEYVNPGHIMPSDPNADDLKREAFEAQQEVASRNPMNTEPDIVTNAKAEEAAEQVKAEAKSKPAKRTAPKADASNK